jgi:ribose 5-phosphate isomerase B
MKVYIASDHAGVAAKEEVKRILEYYLCYFEDLGTHENEEEDYPAYAAEVCGKLQQEPEAFGILICGTGTGMVMAANKFNGIRAAFAYDTYSATMARKDNNANVLTLRAREFDHFAYGPIVKAFITTNFSGEERHERRLHMLRRIEEHN